MDNISAVHVVAILWLSLFIVKMIIVYTDTLKVVALQVHYKSIESDQAKPFFLFLYAMLGVMYWFGLPYWVFVERKGFFKHNPDGDIIKVAESIRDTISGTN